MDWGELRSALEAEEVRWDVVYDAMGDLEAERYVLDKLNARGFLLAEVMERLREEERRRSPSVGVVSMRWESTTSARIGAVEYCMEPIMGYGERGAPPQSRGSDDRMDIRSIEDGDRFIGRTEWGEFVTLVKRGRSFVDENGAAFEVKPSGLFGLRPSTPRFVNARREEG